MNWKQIRERLRHPIVALVWRTHAENRRLRTELDGVKADLAVTKCRQTRWRKAAEIMAGQHPDMEWLVTRYALSDDIADLPEIEARERNASPRSLP